MKTYIKPIKNCVFAMICYVLLCLIRTFGTRLELLGNFWGTGSEHWGNCLGIVSGLVWNL